jgi:hypothetical protein
MGRNLKGLWNFLESHHREGLFQHDSQVTNKLFVIRLATKATYIYQNGQKLRERLGKAPGSCWFRAFNIHSSTARPEVYYCDYVLLNESPFLVHSSEGHGARNQTIEVAAAAVTLATTCLSMTHHSIPPSCDRLNLSQIRT